MKADRLIFVRKSLRWIVAVSIVAIAGLLISIAVGKSSDSFRTNALLSFLGFTIGGLLATVHVAAADRSPRWALAGLTAIAISQTSYLVWVWTGWATHPLLYRVWWISMIPSVSSAHLLALRAAAAGRGDPIERMTPVSVIALGVTLIGFAFYRNLPPQPGPVHLWLAVFLAAAVLIGSIVAWRRWASKGGRRTKVSGGAKIAWLVASHVALLLIGWYSGRATAPETASFDSLPSALTGLPPDRIDTQVRADLKRLRTLAADLSDLEQRASVLDAELRKNLADENRDFYLPKEEDRIRWQFTSYLSLRTALLRLVTTYAGFEAVHDPTSKAQCFTVGYAAAMTTFAASLKLVTLYQDEPLARAKLNEAEPQWGIPAGMFDRIFESITSSRNVELAAEMAAYYESERDRWREAGIWTVEEFKWLDAMIVKGGQFVREHRIDAHRALIDRFAHRVRKDAYTPAYTAQSIVAEWIGDTRIVEKKPLIDVDRIEEIASELRPGDILLERRNWYLSNAFLPGFWPHAALYVGRIDDLRALGIADDPTVRKHLEEYLEPASDGRAHTVIEAVSEGVIFNSLSESMHADYVAVLRPRLPEERIAEAIVRAFRHKGKPYDFEFDFSTSDKLVCTELIYRAYDGMLHFDLIDIMGRPTLPALEIVRQFAAQRSRTDRELDFVLFLDGDRAAGKARRATIEEFCESVHRPRTFND